MLHKHFIGKLTIFKSILKPKCSEHTVIKFKRGSIHCLSNILFTTHVQQKQKQWITNQTTTKYETCSDRTKNRLHLLSIFSK